MMHSSLESHWLWSVHSTTTIPFMVISFMIFALLYYQFTPPTQTKSICDIWLEHGQNSAHSIELLPFTSKKTRVPSRFNDLLNYQHTAWVSIANSSSCSGCLRAYPPKIPCNEHNHGLIQCREYFFRLFGPTTSRQEKSVEASATTCVRGASMINSYLFKDYQVGESWHILW